MGMGLCWRERTLILVGTPPAVIEKGREEEAARLFISRVTWESDFPPVQLASSVEKLKLL
jgi:hypothetical protein